MKKISKLTGSILMLVFVMSCSVREKPEFVEVNKVNISESNKEFVTLNASAVFNNINHIGGELQIDKVDVLISNQNVATLSSETFDVLAKDQFTIPLTAKIETKKLINKQQIGGILQSIIGRKFQVVLKGNIKYNIIGFTHNYNLNETKIVKLKL